jgi:hypothetical protein
MVPICLLIEAVAVEICSRYIVDKWIELTGPDTARPAVASKSTERKNPA